MRPIFSLSLDLPPSGSRDRLNALHRQLRAAILDGRLKPGLRLPPSRALADQLGVARSTVVTVYDLLLSEGHLIARQGAGTFVADLARLPPKAPAPVETADSRLQPFWRTPPLMLHPLAKPPTIDFRVGLSDKGPFPFDVWRRLSQRALRGLSKAPAAYAAAAGRPELCEAIAKHISFARAVACAAEHVVVTAGAQQAFDLLARILVTPGRTVVAVETPGYPPLRSAFAAAGARIVGIPVDAEGMIVERLPPGCRVICVTPSHQFPLGPALSPRRRVALLDFARHNNAVIVEDDYDGEFRFGGRPLEALQMLDRNDSVFYVGTFSKSLFPALRLGFVVTPAWAKRALVTAKQLADWHGPILAQDTLAAFIAEGHLARHMRKMQRIYGERRAALQAALARHCSDRLTPIPTDAGLHLAARLRGPHKASALAVKAAKIGIGLQPLDRYAVDGAAPNGLAFGYGMIEARKIDGAIERLAGIMD